MNRSHSALVRASLAVLITLSAWCVPTLAQRGPIPSPDTPSTQPFRGRPATGPAVRRAEERRRLAMLSRRGVDQIRDKRYAEAEKTLAEAILMAPGHPTNLYNMACVKALRGRADEALDYLERAAEAGFVDFIHIDRDADLVSLRNTPRFKAMVAKKDQYQRKAADQVVEWLKKELGEGYLFEVDTTNKLIFATNTDAQTLAALKTWLVKQAKSQWDMLFDHRPDQYISVVVPSAKDYREIVRQPGVGGFYNHDERILIARQLGQVMTHEFTHALHAADLDPLEQEHALWFAEGLGSLFEAASFDENDVLVPADNFRLSALQWAAQNNRLVPLEELFKMEQKQFVENRRVTYTYGQAGSVLLYLHEQGLLRPFYETYKATHEKDKTAKLALETVTGKTLSEFETEWKQWMLKRTPPRMNTGPGGAFLAVRFDTANDGLRVGSVVPGGAAEGAGIKAGDVIVGLNGTEVRDQLSFMPLLSTYKPGETVTLKVRRGTEYLDLPVTLGTRDRPSRRTR